MSEKQDESSGLPDLGTMTSEFLQLLEKLPEILYEDPKESA